MIKKISLLVLLVGASFASELYIKLGTTTKTSQIEQTKNLLKKTNQTLSVVEKEEKYTLYVGPYANEAKTMRALQNLKQTFPAAVAVKLHAKPDAEYAQLQKAQTSQQNMRKDQSGFFADVTLGLFQAEATTSGNIDAAVLQTPSSSGMSYTLGGGYMFDAQWSGALYYTTLSNSDVALKNIYAGVYYNFLRESDFTLYGGFLAGTSELSWDTPPLQGASASNGSDSFFVGLEAGVDYPLGVAGLSLRASYSLLSMGHETALSYNTQNGTIEHGMLHNLQLGVRYCF